MTQPGPNNGEVQVGPRGPTTSPDRGAPDVLPEDDNARPYLSRAGYQKLRRNVVLSTAAVSIVPLVIMTVINYDQYERALHTETVQSITRLATNNKRALEFFLAERRSALNFIIRDRGFEELCDPKVLKRIMRNLNESFTVGSFVDLGLIDAEGNQLCYEGPYDLKGRNYLEQDWFHRVSRRGSFISDVFTGYRNSPHLAIATRHEWPEHGYYILRATIDGEVLGEQLMTAGLTGDDDVFLLNREGVLQTASRRFGKVLEQVPLPVPFASLDVQVVNDRDAVGATIYLGHALIADSPFVLMFVRHRVRADEGWWPLSARLFAFLAMSVVLILVVIWWGSRQFIENLRSVNMKRAALMHKVEYSNKLASIGRLAAGVAHEINNPLAIINEKAGLLRDLVALDETFPKKEKILGLVDSVLGSVSRCKKITHRLLGFAKHMDIQHDAIDLEVLLKEVVSFLGKEAEYRNLRISFDSQPNIPTIESDRGQLQQVFLNLLNNAVAAVADNGHVNIALGKRGESMVTVAITDDGVGIPAENLQRIFEPFFTTKEGSGTGLGLSITYGIVKKLGGDIFVESEVKVGTRFTIMLPVSGKG